MCLLRRLLGTRAIARDDCLVIVVIRVATFIGEKVIGDQRCVVIKLVIYFIPI